MLKINTELELQKLVPDIEGKGQALGATVTTVITVIITTGNSSVKGKEVIKMNKVLELQKLLPDTEGKGQALGATIVTITTVGKSTISIAKCL